MTCLRATFIAVRVETNVPEVLIAKREAAFVPTVKPCAMGSVRG